MAAEIGDRQWEGNTRCNLGLLLHELEDNAGAREQLEAADRIARSLGHKRLEAFTACNLGIVMEALDDVGAALAAYERAIAATQDLANPRLEGQFRGYAGLAFARVARRAESYASLERGLELLAPSNDPRALTLLHCQYAVATALCGDPELCRDQLAKAEGGLPVGQTEPDAELTDLLALARRHAAPQAGPA